jgi:anaerobic magnesium-protoporphyrin IX monomethyl ester cyclase
LKIGFILAKNEFDVDWYEPLAFGYLKAYLENLSTIPVDMVFLKNLDNLDLFDILAISSTSQDFAVASSLAKTAKLRKPEITIILGGHHITYLPQTLPPEIDFGVISEGEQTFLELVEIISSPVKNPTIFNSVKGIVFRFNGKLIITPERELIEPLDRIPFPFRSSAESVYLFSSRGCPYRCEFCSSSAFWKKPRFFSADYVVKEIENLLECFPSLKQISIWDDLFIANLPRLKKIVSLLEDKKINNKIGFDLAVRANLVTEELCQLLKTMNVKAVGFGVESGSNRILNLLNKGTTVEMNQKAINLLGKYNILTGISLIVGNPSETEPEVRNTFDFVLKNIREKKISSHHAVNILTPMPGTKFWRELEQTKLFDPETFDWNRLRFFASWRNSKFSNLDQWLEYRAKNQSLYLAEDTLSQEKLYALLREYEEQIEGLERTPADSSINEPLTISSRTNRVMPSWEAFWRKLFRVFYLMVTDPKYLIYRLGLSLVKYGGGHSTLSIEESLFQKERHRSIFPFPESKLAHKYCIGHGLEIGGSAHNSFGLKTKNVDYSDSMDTIFKKEEVVLCGRALPVDIVADGDDIPLPDSSQDFVVSSHVIEHFTDPIKALLEWDRLVRPGGIIFMIVPHKERTFDKGWESTPLEHLIADHKNQSKQPHNNPPGVHDHRWVTQDFEELIRYIINELGAQWKIEEVQDVDDKVGNGFTVVIKKLELRKNPSL